MMRGRQIAPDPTADRAADQHAGYGSDHDMPGRFSRQGVDRRSEGSGDSQDEHAGRDGDREHPPGLGEGLHGLPWRQCSFNRVLHNLSLSRGVSAIEDTSLGILMVQFGADDRADPVQLQIQLRRQQHAQGRSYHV